METILVSALVSAVVSVLVSPVVARMITRDDRDDALLGEIVSELASARRRFQIATLNQAERARAYQDGWEHLWQATIAGGQLSDYYGRLRQWGLDTQVKAEPDATGRALIAYFLHPDEMPLPDGVGPKPTDIELAKPDDQLTLEIVVIRDIASQLRREAHRPKGRFWRLVRRFLRRQASNQSAS